MTTVFCNRNNMSPSNKETMSETDAKTRNHNSCWHDKIIEHDPNYCDFPYYSGIFCKIGKYHFHADQANFDEVCQEFGIHHQKNAVYEVEIKETKRFTRVVSKIENSNSVFVDCECGVDIFYISSIKYISQGTQENFVDKT